MSAVLKFGAAIIQLSIVVMPRKADTRSASMISMAFVASKFMRTTGQPWAM